MGTSPSRIVCFGELLLRLGAPGRSLLLQQPRLDVHVGGAEANVAVALARFGHPVAMASRVPRNPLGEAARGELARHGVDTRQVDFAPGRMGLYFLATGAGLRPSEVVYDREHSAFSLGGAESYDWPAILEGARMLHVSGVTPAVGPQTTRAALAAMQAARDAGVTVVFDGNYRAKLWAAWNPEPRATLAAVFALADIAFADHRDISLLLGEDPVAHASSPRARFEAAAQRAFDAFPHLGRIACTHREHISVDRHELGAWMVTRGGSHVEAEPMAVHGIVDRIGAGDAFAAGVLHGLLSGWGDGDALRFGLAAGVLKHSIPGDVCLASEDEVAALVRGDRIDVRR